MAGGRIEARSVVELASAGAVFVGLIFVGLELRQNTAAVEATTLQSSTDASVDYIIAIASDPELTRIWSTPATDLDELTETESMQLHLLIRAQWIRFQNAFLQWQRGTLSDDDWEIYRGYICKTRMKAAANDHAARLRVETWDNHRNVLLAEFVDFVESCRNE